MEVQSDNLEAVVLRIGEAVLATTETVDKLALQVDTLTTQVQQQNYQLFALSDSVQMLIENQENATERLKQLIETLQSLVAAIVESNED